VKKNNPNRKIWANTWIKRAARPEVMDAAAKKGKDLLNCQN